MRAVILSSAQDTNGQNARYAAAARKFGKDKRVLSALAVGNVDPAGVVARFEDAAEKTGELEILSFHKQRHPFAYRQGGEVTWTKDTAPEIRRLAMDADVVHLNNSERAYIELRLRGKPALLHHHGSLFRRDPERMFAIARYYRMTQAVSTLDLTRPDPKALHWLPTAYDLDELAKVRKAHRRPDDGVIRVVSAPTNRELKHTAALVAAVESLQAEGLPVELDLVEDVRYAECLERKAQADVLFDQVAFGYGCNAIEAWGMGLPVIAGADDWTLRRMTDEWGGLPFLTATPETIADAVRTLVESPDARAEWADKGAAHVKRYHAERPALARLAELYHETIRHHAKAKATTKPVTFTNESGRAVYVEGQRVAFPAKVTDPLLVERLRYFAEKRPVYGIREVAA